MELGIILVTVQIILFLWFINAVEKIKLYLRDIRDIAQRLDRD